MKGHQNQSYHIQYLSQQANYAISKEKKKEPKNKVKVALKEQKSRRKKNKS